MEEQKRVKTTKPFWVSIVLSAWGAERDQAGLFVRASDSRREEHSSRQRISAPISSTTSWSCQKEGAAWLSHHTVPTCFSTMTSCGYQTLKYQCPPFLQMGLTWAWGAACAQGSAFFPIAHRAVAAVLGRPSV